MPALRVLWKACVGFYDETVTFLAGNLAWLALNVPFAIVLVLVLLFAQAFVVPDGAEAAPAVQPFVVAGWLLLFLPTPGGAGLAGLAEVAAGLDAPQLRVLFWPAVRRHWRMATLMFAVSLLVLALLGWNVWFYATVVTGPLRFASVVWLYGLAFWLGMQLYLVPLLLHIPAARLLDLYRRAALITLGHPLYTLVLLVGVVLVSVASILLVPLYALVAGGFVALVQAHAFRAIRRAHGEIVDEETEAA